MMTIAAAAMLAAATPQASEIQAPGPQGALAGTLLSPGPDAPVMLIVPGSGPTDRDGNNPAGIQAASYRLIAEGLAARGIASVRIDKRGMFASRAATADPNNVTIAAYAEDVHSWIAAIRERTGARCVWVLGHSEGANVALVAARRPEGLCGLLLVSGAGRRLTEVVREQLRANPANAPLLEQAEAALDSIDAGRKVDVTGMHPALTALFNPAVQGFLIEASSHDPAKLIADVRLPVLILQGQRDIQIGEADARRLAAGNPAARLVLLPDANHVLKSAASNDMTAQLAIYADPALPLAPGVIDALAGFIGEHADAGR